MISKNLVKKNGFPQPLKAHCFQCSTKISIKFVIPRLAYSKKNDWYHWTESQKNQGKYICDTCLLNLYRQDKLNYWELVTNPKKRQCIRTYIHDGTIA